ncbi:MAG: AhpC/TSA family protein [Porphyromonadaceae bacterium]|nr:MAG: AhpC/TSA family protein [Porphyromonadaceae bacterium]
MKQIFSVLLMIALLTDCTKSTDSISVISGKVSHYDAKELYLSIDGRKDTLRIKEDGTFSLEVIVSQPSDAVLQGQGLQLKLYLEPGRDLEININGQGNEGSVLFKGDLALPARYLYEKALQKRKSQKLYSTFYRPPKTAGDFKLFRDSLAQNQFAYLEDFKKTNPGLSMNFYKREKLAISYDLYSDLYGYPRVVNIANRERMNIPSDWYFFLDSINMNDPSILDISEGKWFVTYFVALESAKTGGISYDDITRNADWIRETFKYVKEHLPQQEFYNEIPHYFLTYYMDNDRMGTAGIEDLVSEYLSKSTDETLKKDIRLKCDKWAAIATGQPAPDFTLPNIKGEHVSLDDFRGKYVFIDFWFTGCGTCKAMFPYLKLIMNEYNERNIIFISISVDKERSDWEKMLREGYEEEGMQVLFEEQPNWIHLYGPQSRTLANQYLVSGYPTYILIDRDGKFVRSQCEYPRRMDKIRKLLDAQVGL